MKQLITFKITTKKGKKFFTGELNKHYTARLLVDDLSKTLKSGEHFLAVEKISDKRLDFKMLELIEIEDLNKKTTFSNSLSRVNSANNLNISREMHKIGARYDTGDWRALIEYQKEFDEIESTFIVQDLIAVEFTALEDISVTQSNHLQLRFCGQLILSFKNYNNVDGDGYQEFCTHEECDKFSSDGVKHFIFKARTKMASGKIKIEEEDCLIDFFTIEKGTKFTMSLQQKVYDKYHHEETQFTSKII